MQKTLVLLTLVAFVGIVSCQDSGSGTKTTADSASDPGFQTLNTYCVSCHSLETGAENNLAPTLVHIQTHYLEAFTTEAAFIEAITDFVQHPSEAAAQMPEAVERFGLMPRMEFPDEDLAAIARFLYHADLEKPAGSAQEERSTDATSSDLERGRKYAMATKAVLGKNLMRAIQQRGTEEALLFCSTRAITLTDSMASEQHVRIKRVSDKNRNPDNAANEAERDYIQHIRAALAAGEETRPRLTTLDGTTIAYYPIVTNAMCLQCHGVPDEDITDAVQTRIAESYPNDLATGYGVNEVRGIWVVEMDRP